MNNLSIAGRVGRDAEYRETSGGDSVLNFTVAVDRGKKDGEKLPPLWVSVALWGKQAEALDGLIKKGDPIAVQGQLNFRTYEKTGGGTGVEIQCQFARVTLLGSAKKNESDEAPKGRTSTRAKAVNDEDIPF